MKEILMKINRMKEQLGKVYDATHKFCSQVLNEEVKRQLDARLGLDILDKLSRHKEEVLKTVCPIVVAGETSAGKSSFLNLLLGEDVLPCDHLCATSVLCHIHPVPPDIPCYFEVTMLDGKKETYEGNKTEVVKDLQRFVNKGLDNFVQCKQVDMYWHVELLGINANVTLVDTPGVGENEPLLESVFDYLPNAAVFIYIINSSNAGGVQEDKLVQIFTKLKLERERGGLFFFDPQCTMFICNKWDIVEKRCSSNDSSEQVWLNTKSKLQTHFPDFPLDKCTFKLSIKEERRLQTAGLGSTDEYRLVFAGLKSLIVSSLTGKVNRHYRWLDGFLEDIRKPLASRVNNAHLSQDEKARKHTEVSTRLKNLRANADNVKHNMELKGRYSCHGMASKIHEYIHSNEVQIELRRTIARHVEEMRYSSPSIQNIEATVIQQLNKLLKVDCENWEKRNGFIKSAIERLKADFENEYVIVTQSCDQMEQLIEIRNSSDEAVNDDDSLPFGWKVGLAVGLAVGLPILIPVGLALGIAMLPFTIPYAIFSTIKTAKESGHVFKNKDTFIDDWVTQFMTYFSEEQLEKWVLGTYFEQFKGIINHLSQQIPRQIEAGELLLQDIVRDTRSARTIEGTYAPTLDKLHQLIEMLREFDLRFMSKHNIDVSCICRIKELGIDNSSNVYSAKCSQGDSNLVVALKVLHNADVRTSFESVEVLRKLKHEHVVGFHGFCFSDLMPSMDGFGHQEQLSCHRLMLVFEMCDSTLQEFLFANPDKQCGNKESALEFFRRTARSICEGLMYIHYKGFVHKDIRLRKIMKKGNIVKIMPPLTGRLSGNIGHLWPTAPELAVGGYTKATDVFCLGTVLWELWYDGRSVEAERRLHDGSAGDDTDSGRPLPDCTMERAMPENLARIVIKCWMDDPQDRPAIEAILAVLNVLE